MEYFSPKIKKGIESKTKTISRRGFVLSVAKFAFFGVILSRLAYLQLFKSKEFKQLSDRNRYREIKDVPERGTIFDFKNRVIASNNQIYQLSIFPNEIKNLNEFFFGLGNYINFDILEIKKFKREIYKHKKYKKHEAYIIDKKLSWKIISNINYNLSNISYVQPIVSYERTYRYPEEFAHIIGYVGEPNKKELKKISFDLLNVPNLKIGKNGIEKRFEKKIMGLPGKSVIETDAYGRQLNQVSFDQGKKGDNFYSTLDTDLQVFSKKTLRDDSGSIIVMSTKGEIRCCVSSPSFNSNLFTYGISSFEYKKYLKNKKKPLSNKPLSSQYPPGSTLKMIVALSALENNVVNKNFKVRCSGSTEYFGQKYHCWKDKGHGIVNMKKAIKESCDIYFYEVARLLGVDRLYKTALKFGLDQYVLNSFNEEKKGVFPNTKWKKKYIGQPWYLGETIIAGIGQGYIQTTPIQLCKMIAQIANGGFKIQPSFNLLDEFALGEKIIENQKHLEILQDSLNVATNEWKGTSYKSRIIGDLKFCGKTGTSQVRKISERQRELNIKNKDLPWKFRDHSLFTGYGPVSNPEYAISVVIDHGGSGSSKAAPIAKKVMKKVFQLYYTSS
ncbi:MAG: penicillin-binding protein 2 [Candidatus Pelagibacter sp.]|nr:penicillin-binding protein 2 [Candidatus Pelagibacter sp.]|tara:strand:- start:13700 stop:15538 length:1839 start_codon:yes stop_codon:yes gene_type:complete